MNDKQIILAAEISIDAPDFGHPEPMLDTTLDQLERHGVSEIPEAVIGDARYWHSDQIQSITERGIEVLIPPDGTMREMTRRSRARGRRRTSWTRGLWRCCAGAVSWRRCGWPISAAGSWASSARAPRAGQLVRLRLGLGCARRGEELDVASPTLEDAYILDAAAIVASVRSRAGVGVA